uniref:Sorting nexin-30 n=1 Tax=Cacopsylla melanoneura TaxID=428564 RepID=A0A8D8WMM5_9HEMI
MGDKKDNSIAVLEVSSHSQSVTSLSDFTRSLSFEGSVIASPSIESFSTIADQEASIADLEVIKDIHTRVDNPQKHVDPLESYISFRVTTKTTRSEFPDTECIVRRRYTDFVWLHNKLVETLPSRIIPPLPEKHSLLEHLNRYSKEFILCRMKLLDQFLKRVASHPVLSINSHVIIFLTAKLAEFSLHKKHSPSLLNKMSESFYNLTNIYSTTVSSRHHNSEFQQFSDYISNLYEKISMFEKIGTRLLKERKDYVTEAHQFSAALNTWAGFEPQICSTIRQVSKAVDTTASLHKTLLIDPFYEHNSHPMRDYLLYIDAVKQVLARRDLIQAEYDSLGDDLQKKTAEKDQLTNRDREPSNSATPAAAPTTSSYSLWKSTDEDRLEKLSIAIPKLTSQLEMCDDKLQTANTHLRTDMERWRLEKKNDLKKILLKIADQQIAYYQESLESWEGVLANMN